MGMSWGSGHGSCSGCGSSLPEKIWIAGNYDFFLLEPIIFQL